MFFILKDLSNGRAQRLQREVSITSDRKQLGEMLKAALEANVKKGWSKVP